MAAHNNNNNIHDDIYSAVIMNEVIARVHSVHLVNVEQRQAAADPRPSHLAWAVSPPVFKQLSSTTTIDIFYYYYSDQKLMLIYSHMDGRRLSWPLVISYNNNIMPFLIIIIQCLPVA